MLSFFCIFVPTEGKIVLFQFLCFVSVIRYSSGLIKQGLMLNGRSRKGGLVHSQLTIANWLMTETYPSFILGEVSNYHCSTLLINNYSGIHYLARAISEAFSLRLYNEKHTGRLMTQTNDTARDDRENYKFSMHPGLLYYLRPKKPSSRKLWHENYALGVYVIRKSWNQTHFQSIKEK